MKKAIFAVAVMALLQATSVMAGEKEQDRLKHSGEVLIEIMNIPDSIPRGILDRAECVLIFPSVKKLAIGVGGSFGRGAMSCRSGPEYTGPWGPAYSGPLRHLGVGGHHGRRATGCRRLPDYTGPWGSLAMYALEGGDIGSQLRAPATAVAL